MATQETSSKEQVIGLGNQGRWILLSSFFREKKCLFLFVAERKSETNRENVRVTFFEMEFSRIHVLSGLAHTSPKPFGISVTNEKSKIATHTFSQFAHL